MTEDEFNAQQEELLQRLPEELRNAVGWMAYDRGHAYGYSEVIIHIREMVEQLEEPVRKYGLRVEQQARDRMLYS